MKKATDSMRHDWDARARQNAFFYIASWRKDWDEKSFFASGETDYLALVQPVLERLAVEPRGKSMAELGCGAGRMTRAFASRFASVTAVDISQEMQARAKSYLADFSNIRWVLTDGTSLKAVDTSSLDFVFSYLVLQHYPSAGLVASSIQEMLRILRPGGVFLFQFNGSREPTMNWKGRLVSSIVDGFCALGQKSLAHFLAKLARIDPEMVGRTWRGAALDSSRIEEIVRLGGGVPAGFSGVDTPLAWCFGHKSPRTGS